MKRMVAVSIAAALLVVSADYAAGDEGMWPMDQLPVARLESTYGFEPDQRWIEHVQKSCVRIDDGASGSFVSPRGLVMTNHHVGFDAISDLSDDAHDYIRDGFWAPTLQDELPCPDLYLEVLMEIRDVTEQVEAVVAPEMTPAQARAARQEAVAEIEKQALTETGLHPETVTLFGGARRHLYLYKRYHDVRLVMAPEFDIAFLGGGVANFEYPRYCLDVCFLRAYTDGEPATIEHYFNWSGSGVGQGDLVFVAGHPAQTKRLWTAEHLKFLRDVEFFVKLTVANQREVSLLQFTARGDRQRRIAQSELMAVQNGRKALNARVGSLLDERILRDKLRVDADRRNFILADPERKARYGSSRRSIADALQQANLLYFGYYLLEDRRSPFGKLFDLARDLVRVVSERNRIEAHRLPEYRDSNLEAVRKRLTSPVPIHRELERVLLSDGLSAMARILGAESSRVVSALQGLSPEARADQIIDGTRLDDLEFRTELFKQGPTSIAQCDDPMIRFALRLDSASRTVRRGYETRVVSLLEDAYACIARADRESGDGALYPDATGTLRLSYGTAGGYRERGQPVAAMTALGGAFDLADRHAGQPPFRLPPRWLQRRSTLDLNTAFNFVSTNDITGGNSGSPVLDRNARIVGIVFDSNLQGLAWEFRFDQQQGRAVSVDARAVIETLVKVYGADRLVEELLATQR